MPKRKNKPKAEIVDDIQKQQDAARRRSLISDVVFPHLVDMGETVGYSKIYLQALSGIINGEFDEMRKTFTVGNIHDRIVRKLDSVFDKKDPEQDREYNRYLSLITKLHDSSIQDFTYAAELPRYLDGYLMRDVDKGPISDVDITKILG